jgi:hypothetical protein
MVEEWGDGRRTSVSHCERVSQGPGGLMSLERVLAKGAWEDDAG